MVHCSRINAGAKGAQAWQGCPWRFSGLREDPRGAGASGAVKHQQGMNSRLMEQETPEAAPGRWEMVLRLVLGPKQEFLRAGRTRAEPAQRRALLSSWEGVRASVHGFVLN